MTEWRLLVCAGCAGDASGLVAALRDHLRVDEVPCLGVCARPVTIAAQGLGRATYVFAGVTLADVPDILAFADAYEAAAHGWIADARPLGRLRFCLVTRVPAFAITGPGPQAK